MYTYRILGYATHSETRETLIIYEALFRTSVEGEWYMLPVPA